MSDRSPIFNEKGAQIAYIEGDRAFDLTGRERCKYARATGNLSELTSEKIVGHVSLDSTFVGLTWISDELFGKPSGEVHHNRILLGKQRRHQLPKNANLRRSEKSSVNEPEYVSPRAATAPQLENVIEHPPAVSSSGGGSETDSNTSESVADEVLLPQGELTVGAPDPSKSSSTSTEK
jgi:hypothetical protein